MYYRTSLFFFCLRKAEPDKRVVSGPDKKWDRITGSSHGNAIQNGSCDGSKKITKWWNEINYHDAPSYTCNGDYFVPFRLKRWNGSRAVTTSSTTSCKDTYGVSYNLCPINIYKLIKQGIRDTLYCRVW